MPDSYEARYGLSPANAQDASADLDGDGQSNFSEYLAGTDPALPASSLQISDLVSSGTALQLSFDSVAGKHYSVQFSDTSFSGPWTELRQLYGTGGSVQVLHSGAASVSQRFYRVVLLLW